MDELLLFSKQFSTVLFSTFFIVVLIWAYSKRNKTKLEELKYSIFTEEELRRIK